MVYVLLFLQMHLNYQYSIAWVSIIIFMQKNKYSTTDLHNIKNDIYLGFLAQENFKPTAQSFDISFFGGEPIWLHELKQKQQICSQCNTNLTFLGQIYCPFSADRCYNRILYFLFCDKCLREYKCIRQQAQQQWKPTSIIKSNIKKLGQSREVENDPFSKNQFIKLMSKIKTQLEEDEAIQQADSDEEQDVMNQTKNQNIKQFEKYQEKAEDKPEQQPKNKQKQQPNNQSTKDELFQIYRKMQTQLGNPCMLYSDVALPYNKRVLNPQHFCKQCGSKLGLQVQITQKILGFQNDPNSKLLIMDWGSIMIYTCSASCSQSQEECVVVQFQIDAINEEDIKKLQKSKKNKKKKQKKSKSKSKSKEKNKEQNKDQQSQKQGKEATKQEDGDWD